MGHRNSNQVNVFEYSSWESAKSEGSHLFETASALLYCEDGIWVGDGLYPKKLETSVWT